MSQPTPDAARTVAELREGRRHLPHGSIDARIAALRTLKEAIEGERPALLEALHRDLRKSPEEASLTEIGVVLGEIDHAISNLPQWVRGSHFFPGLQLMPATGRIVPEPLGVALVIAPWNYPLQLALSPVVAAIAAGNSVVLKPSEVAPATSAEIARLARERIDPAWLRVVEGGVEETTALLEQRFDLIFYTGNGRVGRIVAQAAAHHLTPTILELGGKSPVFVDEGVDIPAVARRIAWAKTVNAGQTCVAPDYVMATPRVLDALEREIPAAITRMFGPDPRTSPDYGRIINRAHFERLTALKPGIDADPADLYIAPTAFRADLTHPAMQDEIFGPLLPLIDVSGVEEAIDIINERDKPLALYVMSNRREIHRAFTERTSSGSVGAGVILAHVGSTAMPFGGVGESGMGAYHGKAGFDAFSHMKPVVTKPLTPDTLAAIYPPYAKIPGVLRRLFGMG